MLSLIICLSMVFVMSASAVSFSRTFQGYEFVGTLSNGGTSASASTIFGTSADLYVNVTLNYHYIQDDILYRSASAYNSANGYSRSISATATRASDHKTGYQFDNASGTHTVYYNGSSDTINSYI